MHYPQYFAVAAILMSSFPAFAVPFQTAGPLAGTNADPNSYDDKPQLATDGNGHWVAVWESAETVSFGTPDDENIAVSRSSDNGATWTTPEWLNSTAEDDENFISEATPTLATDGNGTWICAYLGAIFTPTGHPVIQACISTDNGATWGDPIAVNPNHPASGLIMTPNIACDGNGNWVLVYVSSEFSETPATGDADIAVSTSTDGTSWTTPVMLNSEGEDDTEQEGNGDARPVVASDGNGVWVCTWNTNFNRGIEGQGDREISFARSTNNGSTWSNQAVLNAEFDTETGLDENPALASDGNGNWMITWTGYTNTGGGSRYRIWASASTNDGVAWSTRKQVSSSPADDDEVYPDVATDGNGKWVIAWQRAIFQGTHDDYDIAMSESTNNGSTWSAPENLNSNATTDTVDEWYVSIASDGGDHWTAIWRTVDTSNNDLDIWRAISGEGGGSAFAIIAPNGGEKWKQGKKQKIKWEPGDAGENVKLELLRNGTVVNTIKNATPNDGQMKWKVPNSLAPGNGYKVRATSKSNNAIKDSSDGSFKVKTSK